MFTGIITTTGNVTAVEERGGDLRLSIGRSGLNTADISLGESIATNGICLTVVDILPDGFVADLSVETLKLTTARDWHPGQRVNLERSLRLSDRLGGHLVSGHVDGVGEVLERHGSARAERFLVQAPAGLARYIARKGSITVDGTSLTVNSIKGTVFELTIVPHTLEHTIMADYQPGTRVNLEVDLVARYLERLVKRDAD